MGAHELHRRPPPRSPRAGPLPSADTTWLVPGRGARLTFAPIAKASGTRTSITPTSERGPRVFWVGLSDFPIHLRDLRVRASDLEAGDPSARRDTRAWILSRPRPETRDPEVA